MAMKININNKENETTPLNLSLDFLAEQWATLVIAHIQAKQNLKKYNDYKFPTDIKTYEP